MSENVRVVMIIGDEEALLEARDILPGRADHNVEFVYVGSYHDAIGIVQEKKVDGVILSHDIPLFHKQQNDYDLGRRMQKDLARMGVPYAFCPDGEGRKDWNGAYEDLSSRVILS